jgi:hypothetical protein
LRRVAAAITATLLLAGCATPRTAADGPGSCDAAAAPAFLGQPADKTMLARLREATRTKSTRLVRPGMVVTMDYIAGRLTVAVDEAGRISRASCG